MTLVVDASIIIRLLANTGQDELLQRRLSTRLHAPALLDAEVSSVIRGFAITGKPGLRISAQRAREMLDDYAALPIVRYPMRPLQTRVFELRNNLTAYDAMYVALAETLDMPLLTGDAKFAGATGHRAKIQHYP